MKEIVKQGFIKQSIFVVRGHKVMLDRDLAMLYGVETRIFNQAVRRNIDRFPNDFMFSLAREEILNLSQTVISSKIKHAPNVFVFTEQGVAMLSSVLNSKRAIQVNIAIMRAFVRLRQVLASHKELAQKLEEHEKRINRHDHHIVAIFDIIKELMKPPPLPPPKPKGPIGFK